MFCYRHFNVAVTKPVNAIPEKEKKMVYKSLHEKSNTNSTKK